MNTKPQITEETAERVIEHHFGKRPKSVIELSGGIENFVYEAEVDKEKFIVRMSDIPTKLQFFMKEQWAVSKAREKKIPVPEILEVGNDLGLDKEKKEEPNKAKAFPYMIVRKVDGYSATLHPDRWNILRQMGEYTALINSIPTSDFGHIFDWSSNTLSRRRTWKEYLEKELEVWERIELLERNIMMTASNLKKLKRHVRDVLEWTPRPALNHGDMRLKNILLNEKGKISAILDWENCMSNIVPLWEISIALHDLNNDEKEMFLEGYGMTEKEYLKLLPGLKVINILNYCPTIELALKEKNRIWLERIRLRLNGHFDLYSL